MYIKRYISSESFVVAISGERRSRREDLIPSTELGLALKYEHPGAEVLIIECGEPTITWILGVNSFEFCSPECTIIA